MEFIAFIFQNDNALSIMAPNIHRLDSVTHKLDSEMGLLKLDHFDLESGIRKLGRLKSSQRSKASSDFSRF